MQTITEWIALHEADLTFSDITDRVRDEILELLGGESDDRWIWIRDITDSWVVYEDEGSGSPSPGCYRVGYTLDDSGDVTVVGSAVPVEATTVYTPEAAEPASASLTIATPSMSMQSDEAARDLVGDTIPLVESVVRTDGTVPIKIIAPGWGTSGYYSENTIKETGPQAFPAGTHMFWDHPSASEDVDRPERSLRDLSAVLASDAYWQEAGPAGPGLYGDAKVFADYQPALEELAPHIGVSIRATGKAHLGEAGGQRGLIIDEIVDSKSVDFVTAAGAGGEVLSLFESIRGHTPKKVKESTVDLKEALAANTTLTTELQEARALGELAAAERDQLRTEHARLAEAAILREARDVVSTALLDDKHRALPKIAVPRLVEALSSNPPVKDGKLDTDLLTGKIDEAVKAEVAYLASVTGSGRVRGVGDTIDVDEADTTVADSKLDAAFADLGLSESARKFAVAGR